MWKYIIKIKEEDCKDKEDKETKDDGEDKVKTKWR